ncbi:MAG: hypothetical protein HKN45_07270 [Flavobacteriales bacterium]|nr:hypothetical protein [Flavobacteriales bacterium]
MAENIISDILDRSISAIFQPVISQFPHIKQVFLARMVITESGDRTSLTIDSEEGETVSTFAERNFIEPCDLFANDRNRRLFRRNDIDSIYADIPSGSEVNYHTRTRSVSFEPIMEGEVDETVYLVVQTENFRRDQQGDPRKLKVELMNGNNSPLGAADTSLTITHEGTQKSELELEVGTFLKDSQFTNKDDFLDYAIIRIRLAGNLDSKKDWLKKIGDNENDEDRYAPIYFKADAHSMNVDIPEAFMLYYGEEVEGEWTSDKFWYGDGLNFEIIHSGAPWMKKALAEGLEMGGDDETVELVKNKVNDLYFPICGRWLSVPSNWCAGFLSYNFFKANYKNPLDAGAVQAARDSTMKQIDRPVYGAVSVWRNYIKKSYVDNLPESEQNIPGRLNRTESFNGVQYYLMHRGHVGFIYGKRVGSRDGHYLIYGGNQSKKAMVKEYDCTGDEYRLGLNKKRKHIGFFVPVDYEVSMADGLSSPTDTLDQHTHLLDLHLYADIPSANEDAIGVRLDASGNDDDGS